MYGSAEIQQLVLWLIDFFFSVSDDTGSDVGSRFRFLSVEFVVWNLVVMAGHEEKRTSGVSISCILLLHI
jgi:hypothetical protein